MATTIDVERLDVMDFMVTVTDESGPTQHFVIASYEEELAFGGNASVEELIAETFRFLLEHEPHSMIQEHFTLKDIARQFIEYEYEMKRRLNAA
ncbi:MAG: hypothetical protein OES13_10695 [Acidimicrobiia bacterium]|nr:hypothetical protein [Acidimicrobiia bacterium]